MIFLFSLGFLEINLLDIIDILLVTVLLYQLYKLLTGSVALKIFLGLLSIYLLYLVVRAAGMELLSIILGQFMGVGVLAAIIVFQPEIRRFLLPIGKTTAFNNDRFFRGWSGVRIGFYFAPGYGYYQVPRNYWGQRYHVGDYLPSIFWRYRLDDWRTYGLGYPPEGTRWVSVDNTIYLIDEYDGYIIDVIYDAWSW